MKEHEIKCWQEFFQALLDGRKNFEVRYNDRDYREGDILVEREFVPDQDKFSKTGKYTGRELRFRVTYVMRGPILGISEGWIVMGLKAEKPSVHTQGRA